MWVSLGGEQGVADLLAHLALTAGVRGHEQHIRTSFLGDVLYGVEVLGHHQQLLGRLVDADLLQFRVLLGDIVLRLERRVQGQPRQHRTDGVEDVGADLLLRVRQTIVGVSGVVLFDALLDGDGNSDEDVVIRRLVDIDLELLNCSEIGLPVEGRLALLITADMKLVAARAVADLVGDVLEPGYIVPGALDASVAPAVAEAVEKSALEAMTKR